MCQRPPRSSHPIPSDKVIWEQRETEQGQRQEFQHKTQELSSGSPAFPTQWDQFGSNPRYTTSSHRNKCTLGPKVASIPNPSEVRELDKMLSSSCIDERKILMDFENIFIWWNDNSIQQPFPWRVAEWGGSWESGIETWARLDPSSSIPDVQ